MRKWPVKASLLKQYSVIEEMLREAVTVAGAIVSAAAFGWRYSTIMRRNEAPQKRTSENRNEN